MKGERVMETYYKRKRKKTGLAPSDIAKELGINCKKYSLIENGVVKMPKNLIDKFNKIVSREKNLHTLAKMTNEKLVTDFWNEMRSKTDGKYNLKTKMKEFNIETFKELGDLIGVSNSNISHYLNEGWKVPYDFMNKVYMFFEDELNIQAPKKKPTSPLKGKKRINQVGRSCKDLGLVDWYKTTDLIKLAKENNLTHKDISNGCGVSISSVLRAMKKSTNIPSYNTLKRLKEYFDKFQINPTIFDDEWTKQPCETINVDEFVMPELEQTSVQVEFHEFVEDAIEKCNTSNDIRQRYQTEIEENNVIIETYQGIINNLINRNRICEEVLKVIEELRGE
jgi:transcriptional regulator with XRE-family HTH domain